MTVYEMEGFLRGKCLPGDMKVNESNAQYLVRKFSEFESNLSESKREFRAADATIHNLELKLTDIAVQLANAESKCRELAAAENNLIDSECHVAELEDALRDKQALIEAAEKRIAEHNFENRLLANADRDIKALRQRIAELEAGTVAVKQFGDFQIVHYGGSEDYAKGYIDCQNNYNKALAAAGIGVKG
ncbi:hypothetical protein E6P06_19905 [Citrobacter sp. CF971]|nr:hypothetical protein E6P06_19905 [Citrobacter sp. CF971]